MSRSRKDKRQTLKAIADSWVSEIAGSELTSQKLVEYFFDTLRWKRYPMNKKAGSRPD